MSHCSISREGVRTRRVTHTASEREPDRGFRDDASRLGTRIVYFGSMSSGRGIASAPTLATGKARWGIFHVCVRGGERNTGARYIEKCRGGREIGTGRGAWIVTPPAFAAPPLS
jgi:hypothetical protein